MAHIVDRSQHENRNKDARDQSVDEDVLFHFLVFGETNVGNAGLFPVILSANFLQFAHFPAKPGDFKG
jgi:hypothetical protein